MKKAVAEAFIPFITPYEGYADFLYKDAKGLVTTGIGNLLDSPEAAVRLPWKKPNGSMATRGEIMAAWWAVKGSTISPAGGGGAYATVTTIRLSKASVDALVRAELFRHWGELKQKFPQADAWCADAQLGVAGMMWALGPAFGFPKFTKAGKASPPDYETMANECSYQILVDGVPLKSKKLDERNAVHRDLFLMAAKVTRDGLDPEKVWYLSKAKKCPTCGQATP